jgi:Holliday junction resolvasome RuvABC endonuclease subunit
MFVIAIDPGSGVSSPTGLTIIEYYSKEIFVAKNLYTKKRELAHRIKDISDNLEIEVLEFLKMLPKEAICLVCIESFVMRGKGGETLQRLIGSFMGRIPYHIPIEHVQNTTVKLAMAGNGHAEKELVALGVLKFFESNQESKALIEKLTKAKEADILDSFAIGVTGCLKLLGKSFLNLKKAKKRSK